MHGIHWRTLFFSYCVLKFLAFPLSVWLNYSEPGLPEKWTSLRKYFYFLDLPFPTPVFWSRELYNKNPVFVYLLSVGSFAFSALWILVLVTMLIVELS